MSDPYSPVTTSRVLQMPQGHRIYSTTRKVATEFPLPAIGVVLSANNFIAGFINHYILDVSESPIATGGKNVTVTHGTIPSSTFTEYESQAFTFPPIYPSGTTFMPGGSRSRQRVVPARVTYEYRLVPGSWLTDAAIWDYADSTTGPFEVKSYIARAAGENFVSEDGSSGSVGSYLNAHFIGIDTVNNEFSIYAPGDLFYIVDASAPSADTYSTWVTDGTELMASRTLHKWYCGYMRRTSYVRAQ